MSERGERSASKAFADFSASLTLDAVAPEAARAAALHLLDTLGCGIAARCVGAGGYVTRWAEHDAPPGPSRLIGGGLRVDAGAAAFVNGALCHALDFDDTHGASICHISSVVAPAALAVADLLEAPGDRLLAAIVAGNETVARIGIGAVGAYMRRGFHHTGVCGAFGATVAAAHVLRLDAESVAHALGICQSMAAGSFAYLSDGSTAKLVNVGHAARAGILAAQLAGRGGDGPAAALEGRFGAFESYFGVDGSAMRERLDDLGEIWETAAMAFKPYPACHFVHAPVDAARDAADALGVLGAPDRIEAIEVEIPAPGMALVAEPAAEKLRPRTPYEGKFSVQYSVAAMLERGQVTIETYTPGAISAPTTLALAARVEVRAAEFSSYPASFPARVTVRLNAGPSHTVELVHQRGGVARPLTEAEVQAKFAANAGLGLDPAARDELAARTISVSKLESARALTDLLAFRVPAVGELAPPR